MTQSVSRHSDSPSAGQELPLNSWNPKVYYHTDRSFGDLCAMNYMLLYSILISSSPLRQVFRFPHQDCMYIFFHLFFATGKVFISSSHNVEQNAVYNV